MCYGSAVSWGTATPQRGQGSVTGSEHAFSCCSPVWGREERGKAPGTPTPLVPCPHPSPPSHPPPPPPCSGHPAPSSTPPGDAAPSSSAHNDAEQSARGCARDDRLCTDMHYMIIIIILPRIHDERGGYDSYKEALVSRSCSQFFPHGPAPSRGCSWLCSGPAIA